MQKPAESPLEIQASCTTAGGSLNMYILETMPGEQENESEFCLHYCSTQKKEKLERLLNHHQSWRPRKIKSF